MRRVLLHCTVAVALLAGCGKKEPAPEAKAPDAAGAKGAGGGEAPTPPPAKKAADAEAAKAPEAPAGEALPPGWQWEVERFADLRVLRYRVIGWDALELKTKQLLYYLSEAALAGRDIAWDQFHRHALRLRRTLEAIWTTYQGPKDPTAWPALVEYTKRVWFSYGNYHHNTNKKFLPAFTPEDFEGWVRRSDAKALPLLPGEELGAFLEALKPVIFDATVEPLRLSTDADKDLVTASAGNFYMPGVTQAEVEAFYAKLRDPNDPTPPMWGLNSRIAKDGDGRLVEQVWRAGEGGLYAPAIEKVIGWLEKAATVAEDAGQKETLDKLVAYYRTGDLKQFDAFNIAWVADQAGQVDFIQGFVETYGDPLDLRGTYEALVWVADPEATKRIAAIAAEAQWFEDQSPIDAAWKKPDVKGISASVIQVVAGAGDTQPSFPIGINLPNSQWIREKHGSKSVNLGNIVEAYEEASRQSGVLEAFAATPEEVARAREFGDLADKLHTDMHEVIGHASGRLKEGVLGPSETLKSYASTLEEGRADLVGLYFIMDQKLIDMGLMPSFEVGKASYDETFRVGLLTQLARVPVGEALQEAHARNRMLNAAWVVDHSDGAVERFEKDGKTYYKVKDYERVRVAFGELLKEMQRIKSVGDYEAAKKLVDTWGSKPDPKVHAEVVARWEALGVPKYSGFINPRLEAVERDGAIVDVEIHYDEGYAEQMLRYGKQYAHLPHVNY